MSGVQRPQSSAAHHSLSSNGSFPPFFFFITSGSFRKLTNGGVARNRFATSFTAFAPIPVSSGSETSSSRSLWRR